MRRYLAVCFLLVGALTTTACVNGNSVPQITPAPKLASNGVLVTVVNPFTSSPVAGIAVTQSLDVDDTSGQPLSVIATQNTDSSGNTTFAVVQNTVNCFSIPITPTHGLLYAVDCSFPVPSQVTLNHI